MGNSPAVASPEAIAGFCGYFFSMIKSIKHELVNSCSSSSGDCLTWEGSVTYGRLDETSLTVPFCNVVTFDGDMKVVSYNVYLDSSKLFPEAA